MNLFRTRYWLLVGWGLLMVGYGLFVRPLDAGSYPLAQTDPGWSQPLMLVETRGRVSHPELVVDSAGTPHVFWEYGAEYDEEDGAGQAIYYTTWSNGDWSEPVDVVVSPDYLTARLPNVAIDVQDRFHLVWSAGDRIFYSQADVANAGTAQGWTTPLPLNSGASSLEPTIALSPTGQIFVVWTQAGAGLMFVRSVDGGQNWSNPLPIFLATGTRELAGSGRIAVDAVGRLHVVFTHSLSNDSNSSRPDPSFLYYLRSKDGGMNWTEPLLMTDVPDFGQITVLTAKIDEVHLVWNGRAGTGGRYHRWSEDAGTTWTPIETVISPNSLYGDGGLTGYPAVVMDSQNRLHLVSSSNRNNYYMQWNRQNWSLPINISSGLDGWGVTHTTQTLEAVSMAIGRGNQLHLVFHDGFERIWYTSRILNVPALPIPTIVATTNPSNLPQPQILIYQRPLRPVVLTPTIDSPVLPTTFSQPPAFLPLLYGLFGATAVILMFLLYRQQNK